MMLSYLVPMIWIQCFSKDVPGRELPRVLIKMQIPASHPKPTQKDPLEVHAFKKISPIHNS